MQAEQERFHNQLKRILVGRCLRKEYKRLHFQNQKGGGEEESKRFKPGTWIILAGRIADVHSFWSQGAGDCTLQPMENFPSLELYLRYLRVKHLPAEGILQARNETNTGWIVNMLLGSQEDGELMVVEDRDHYTGPLVPGPGWQTMEREPLIITPRVPHLRKGMEIIGVQDGKIWGVLERPTRKFDRWLYLTSTNEKRSASLATYGEKWIESPRFRDLEYLDFVYEPTEGAAAEAAPVDEVELKSNVDLEYGIENIDEINTALNVAVKTRDPRLRGVETFRRITPHVIIGFLSTGQVQIFEESEKGKGIPFACGVTFTKSPHEPFIDGISRLSSMVELFEYLAHVTSPIFEGAAEEKVGEVEEAAGEAGEVAPQVPAVALEERLLSEFFEILKDPISLSLMIDPVMASDGHIYDRESIEELARAGGRSPMTREFLNFELHPVRTLRQIIEKIVETGLVPEREIEEYLEAVRGPVAE